MKQTNEIEKIPNKLLGFYLYFFKPFKWFVLIAFSSWMLGQLIGRFLVQYTIRDIISIATEEGTAKSDIFSNVLPVLFILWGLILLEDIFLITQALIYKKYGPAIKANINVRMLKYVHNHSYRYFANNFGGSIANKISDLSNTVLNIYNTINYTFAPSIMILVINVIFFTYLNPLLGALMLVWMILHLSYLKIRIPVMRKNFKAHSEELSSLRGHIVDSLSNFMLVKLNSKQQLENKTINNHSNIEKQLNIKTWTETQKTWIPLSLLSGSFFTSIIFLMFYLYSKEKIDIADISYVLITLKSIFESVWRMNDAILDFLGNTSKMQQALDTLLVPVEIEDKRGAKNLRVKEGNIELKNVVFHYGNEKNILDNFDLHIKPGEKVGIVGPSGAGKTTLVNLLLRMFDVQKGEILIDGQNVENVKQKSLRENISVVTQDSTLFHRTLRENIGYTKEKATEKEIISASKKAGAHDFIKELPKKYETLVGERGIKLSGGQRQRVNIARTILKDAPILILDEATSALDSETEAYIQTTFEKIMQGKTTIAIAHRLSTLKLMDRIIVINHGKIIEEGSHRSLIAKKGTYSKLWSLQSSNFIENEDL